MSKKKLLESYARSLQDTKYYFQTKSKELTEDIELSFGKWRMHIKKGSMMPDTDLETLTKHMYMNYLVNEAYKKGEITLSEIDQTVKTMWEESYEWN